jgi:Rrf2 family protein
MDAIAQGQGIPRSFLENILKQLCSVGVVRSHRGPAGGYWLARPPDELNIAHIIRAVEGPLVGVRGQRPEEIEYVGSAESLQQAWIALRANLRRVLEHLTIADVAAGRLRTRTRAHAQRGSPGDALAGTVAHGATRSASAEAARTNGRRPQRERGAGIEPRVLLSTRHASGCVSLRW